MARIPQSSTRNILITGGAGFIGSNLAARLLAQPETRITLFDNLSRSGVEHNLAWLKSIAKPNQLHLVRGDVRNFAQVVEAAQISHEIYHLAAQVAVTTSVADPTHDFDVNARGTFNVLEAARRSGQRPFVLFTSTNKVYGSLDTLTVEPQGTRYGTVAPDFHGVPESTPLDFHSPYGCSKGSADQYVRDYARVYDLPTVVFRMSCIAGPRQFGNEDQGWVAHFLYSVLAERSINIYGNGLQVRDILHVADLIDAMQSVRNHIDTAAGQVYNVGGGPQRSASIVEMLAQIERLCGIPCRCTYSEVRTGDQPLYISDTAKLSGHTGWHPRRSVEQVLRDIYTFWQSNKDHILAQHPAFSEQLVEEEVA